MAVTVRTSSPTTAPVAPPAPGPSPEELPALCPVDVARIAAHCSHPRMARVAALLLRDWSPMGEPMAFYDDGPTRFFRPV